jgi:chemotaxis methyl-accepting protein methylase
MIEYSLNTNSKAKMIKHIIGIGASAGGLDALFALLPHLQPNGDATYIIAQHMAHDGHCDLVQKLLSRYSNLEVRLATDAEVLLSDHIYLIPAGSDGVVDDGKIYLQAPSPGHVSTPCINVLFKSIAQSHQDCAIGVVLSGTGSDGTLGCREIKHCKGLVLAQNPDSAEFNGMPSAAIEAGVVDQICDAQQIAALIVQKVAKNPIANFSTSDIQLNDDSDLLSILDLVLQKTGISFIEYKTETLRRRLDTRIAGLKIASISAYFDYLKHHENEIFHLQQLFLVSYSSFFRDAQSFEVLGQYLYEIMDKKNESERVNIWVPGCASGEEVYTLAIILEEIRTVLGKKLVISVKGTDLNPIALAQANAGVYPLKAFKEMKPHFLEKYFEKDGDSYIVGAQIKSICQFEQNNVFGKNDIGPIDLISCRNLLIYLKSRLQEQLIHEFHLYLVPSGVLFLGQSETLSPTSHAIFKQVDFTHRLYVRR